MIKVIAHVRHFVLICSPFLIVLLIVYSNSARTEDVHEHVNIALETGGGLAPPSWRMDDPRELGHLRSLLARDLPPADPIPYQFPLFLITKGTAVDFPEMLWVYQDTFWVIEDDGSSAYYADEEKLLLEYLVEGAKFELVSVPRFRSLLPTILNELLE